MNGNPIIYNALHAFYTFVSIKLIYRIRITRIVSSRENVFEGSLTGSVSLVDALSLKLTGQETL